MSSQRLTIFLANTRTAVLPLGACGSQHPYGADAQAEEDAPCFISLMPAAPHFPVKIEYARGGLHLVSEIVALAIGV